MLVREGGLEPPSARADCILSPARLPISPLSQKTIDVITNCDNNVVYQQIFTMSDIFYKEPEKVSREIVAKDRRGYELTAKIAAFLLFFLLVASVVLKDLHAGNRYVKDDGTRSKVVAIALDAGHGGHDSGVTGPSGVREKDITLSLAQALNERLSGRYNVLMTRTGDYWIDIEERTAMANNHDADILISLHTGGGFRHKTSGAATFYWSGREAKRTGQAAMASEDWNSREESPAWACVQEKFRTKSRALALRVHKQLIDSSHLNDRGCRIAPLYLLGGANMPAILIEVGCLTNPADEKQLSNPLFITIVADTLNEIITGLSELEKDHSMTLDRRQP